ncbi:virion core protein [Spirochaetia bacterium]|nr:virion core protein [Spirochaetia bacterium]
MGLIKAITGAAGGMLADQWLEFFVCESLEADILAAKGQKRISKRSSNTKGEDNIISNGSGIVVNKGQAAIIVDQGKVAEFIAEEGKFTYDQSSEPSFFAGDMDKAILGSLKSVWERFKHGGSPGRDQRVYYFNTKEIMGNKYGTPSPIPYKIIDPDINLKLTISLRCNGEYSYRIVDPMLFYANVCGNVDEEYTRDKVDSQLKSELLTALGPAFAKLGGGLEYHEIPAKTLELAKILNEELSSSWKEGRGIEIVKFGISAINAPKEDEDRIKQLQTSAVMRDPTMAAATLVNAQSDAMRTAAGNQGGAAMGFMGMGMAGNAGGMNAQNLFAMGAQQQQAPAPQGNPQSGGAQAAGWDCPCGHKGNTGKFCAGCGKAKSESGAGWKCECGTVNGGKFCADCGKPKPAGAPLYRCDKCGWEPPDPKNVPKFCPECGDVFDENDIKK